MRRGRTASDRDRYWATGAPRSMMSNVLSDNGERVPFVRVDGVKSAMLALRETKRLNGSWTAAEREAVSRLVVQAHDAGWTWREMARNLGNNETGCRMYWKKAQEGTE